MMMQEYIKNEDGPIPVTSVRQLVSLGNWHDSFISGSRFERIDEILNRIPQGTVSLSRKRSVFNENLLVRIQVVKPELCGTDDNSIRLLNGRPDKKREISWSDETALVSFLQEQGFNEEHLEDCNDEVCARYFVRSIAITQPTK